MNNRTVMIFALGAVAGYYVGPRLVGKVQSLTAARRPAVVAPPYVVR